MSRVLSVYDQNANYRRPNPVSQKISYINSLYNEIASEQQSSMSQLSLLKQPMMASTKRLSSTMASTPAPHKHRRCREFQVTERVDKRLEEDAEEGTSKSLIPKSLDIESPQLPIKPTQLLEEAKMQTSPHFQDTHRQILQKNSLQLCEDFTEHVQNKSTFSGKSGRSGRSQRTNYSNVRWGENDSIAVGQLEQKWAMPEQTKNKTEMISKLFDRVSTFEKSPLSSQRSKNFVQINKLSSSISRKKHPGYEKILAKLNAKDSGSPLFRLDISRIPASKKQQQQNAALLKKRVQHQKQSSQGGRQHKGKQKSFCSEFNSSCDYYYNSHYCG